jgi:hypothetical protein
MADAMELVDLLADEKLDIGDIFSVDVIYLAIL